ncbi:MAG: flagellar filament outer layer protein FlaA [Treponema sp.]|nr:flagellar filament outer layer protein FlaA [Treponema sp.]
MKKMLILVTIVSLVAGSLFAEEAVLIDFSNLTADIRVSTGPNDEGTAPNQNRHTMMDFSGVRFGGSFTQEQRSIMRTSLAIENWEVELSSSSRTIDNMVRSFTREAPSRQFGSVMGVRVRFPQENFNARALIKPPFEIPAFEPLAEISDDGTINPTEDSNGITNASRFEEGYGVVKNVGTIKSVAVNVYGLNFPHGLNTLILDDTGRERKVFMGYLNFDGWGELVWNNPQYIQEVRNRDLRLWPLYPESTPFIKFNGFEILRDGAALGGDFITYFKDVRVIFDKAVLDQDRDIDDEALWGIIRDRETTRSLWEMERFGQNQVLRYLEQQRQADPQTTFTPAQTVDEQ